MEKHTITYLGKKTEVTGNYQVLDNKEDFCCNEVKADGKGITHKLDLADFKAIEVLVLIERNK